MAKYATLAADVIGPEFATPNHIRIAWMHCTPLCAVYNALRWIVRTGSPWRYIPNDLPVELAFVDQGYTGEAPAEAAQSQGIQLGVVKYWEAKRGFVLLPRR